MNLLKEYLTYVVNEKRAPRSIPPEAQGLYHGGYGKYYTNTEPKQYVGSVINGKWVPAKNSPLPAGSLSSPGETPEPDKSTTGAATAEPTAATSTTATVTEPERNTPGVETPAPVISKSDTVVVVKEPRSVEVMGNLFSPSREIERGGVKTAVRFILDPQTKQELDITDEEQRSIAISLLDEHLATLDDEIKAKVRRVNQKISKTERQQLRKWLGNVGELYGLRKMLETGTEAYLYADSNPKNDIAVVFEYGEGETDADVRGCTITGVSTKTSTGVKVGRKESSSQPFVMESVEGKTIQIPGKDGQMEDIYAEDAVVALYAVFNQTYVSSTRGFVVRGKNFREERAFSVNAADKFKFDEATLKLAMKEQAAAAARGESGGQKKFVEARKLLPSDIELAFDKNGNAYNRIVKKVAKSMGEEKTPETLEKAQRLVDHFVDKIRTEIMQKSIDTKGRGYRLSDVNDFLLQNVADMLRTTNSDFAFQSDLMTVSFDDRAGFSGLKIVPGEVMRHRVETYFNKKLQDMDVMEQLLDAGNWEINTRGLGLSSSAGGYLGPLPRVSPATQSLTPEDYLTPDAYMQFLKELHRRRTVKELEEYLWR